MNKKVMGVLDTVQTARVLTNLLDPSTYIEVVPGKPQSSTPIGIRSALAYGAVNPDHAALHRKSLADVDGSLYPKKSNVTDF